MAPSSLPLSNGQPGCAVPAQPPLTITGEAKSYAERMFTFPEIGSLEDSDARRALVDPSAAENVEPEPEALDRVLALTEGYPYFVQEFGKQTWDAAEGSHTIAASDAERAVPLAVAELDSGFFQVRTERLTDNERWYLRAMDELLDPCAIGCSSERWCLSPQWGELAFTVPMFDQFTKRWMPWSPLGKRPPDDAPLRSRPRQTRRRSWPHEDRASPFFSEIRGSGNRTRLTA